jgi:hypothetical protein
MYLVNYLQWEWKNRKGQLDNISVPVVEQFVPQGNMNTLLLTLL